MHGAQLAAEQLLGLRALLGVEQPHMQRAAAHRGLELARRALGDDLAVVDDRDAVGQLVGLLQVLGAEQDRRAARHQRADDVPHLVARARVEPGRGLVEEHQLRRDHDARGDVQPPASAREVLDELARRLGEAEGLEQLRRAGLESWLLIAGPSADPAKLREATSGADAFRRMATARAPYVSRGDDSDTHLRERELLKAAGVDPNGAGPGSSERTPGWRKTLLVAGEKKAYTLTDLASFLASRKRTRLERLTKAERVDDLRSIYALLQVNPGKVPGKIRAEAASTFVEWFLRPTTARKIATFKRAEYGEPLFRPLNLDED